MATIYANVGQCTTPQAVEAKFTFGFRALRMYECDVVPDFPHHVTRDGPLTRAFWLGDTDARPLAIFRIAFGLSILHDLVDYSLDLRAFIADDGMLPRAAMHDWWTWGVFNLCGSFASVVAVYALGCVAVAAFTAGFYTRIATVLSWLFLISLHHRNAFVTDGGDELTRILLFWSLTADLGARYSVDAWRKKLAPTRVPAFGLRLLQAQIAVLYLVAGILKLRIGWLHGDAIFLTLQLDGFVRPLGAWLGQHPSLCAFATRAIVLMELAFPFAAFSPIKPRISSGIAIALGLAIQGGILLTMRVGIFTEVMIASMALWLGPRLKPEVAADAPTVSPLRLGVHALFALQFVLAIWDPFLARRLPLPKVVQDERMAIGIVQAYGLFDVTYSIPRWQAPGALADGTPVEVLERLAPGARPRGAAIRFSRWNKFTFKSIEHPLAFPELGAYLCRAHAERGEKLASFTLVNDATPARKPNGDSSPPTRAELWHQSCQ